MFKINKNCSNEFSKGDIVLVHFSQDINTMATVYENLEDRIVLKDIDGIFELTKEYVLRKGIVIELMNDM